MPDERKTSLPKGLAVALLLLCGGVLSGCVAAALPLAYAATAGSFALTASAVYKTSGGGNVTVNFEGNDVAEHHKAEVRAIDTIAIWPDGQSDVYLAEKLTASGYFEVVTPAESARIIEEHGLPNMLNMLTTGEQEEALRKLAETANTDAVVVAGNFADINIDTNTWSFFERSKMSYSVDAFLYSKASDTIAWRDMLSMEAEIGSKSASQTELHEIAADAVANQLLVLTGRRAPEERRTAER